MAGIAEKLKFLIADNSVQSWAVAHGLPSQTVHEWVKHDRMPRGGSFDLLIKSTGKPKEWWLDGEDEQPLPLISDRRVSQATFKEAQRVDNVNYDLLEAAEVAVHRFLKREGVSESPERVAKLVIAIYKYGAAKGMAKPEDLDDFLKLVA